MLSWVLLKCVTLIRHINITVMVCYLLQLWYLGARKIQVLAVHSYSVLSAAPVIDDRAIRTGTTTFPESEFKPVQLRHTL